MACGGISGVGGGGAAGASQVSGCEGAADACQGFAGSLQKASKCGGSQDGGNGIEELLKMLMAAMEKATGAQQGGAAAGAGVG